MRASHFILEPQAKLLSAGRGYVEGGPGAVGTVGAGAGHATVGGNGRSTIALLN